MSVLQQVIALLLTLGILVTVHEFGHFWVARRCGVKVLRFSIGFGTPIYRYVARSGTEFVIAAIPLGGYVKMLDEREGPVPDDEKHRAFNSQPVGSRIAIAAAGPLFNFLFAFLVYLLLYSLGFRVIAPVIGNVEDGSPAALGGLTQGLEILRIDDEPVNSWQAVNLSLASHIGEDHTFLIKAREFGTEEEPDDYRVSVAGWMKGQPDPMPLDGLGFSPYRPNVEPIVGLLTPGLAGESAGLMVDDRILSIEGKVITSWEVFVSHIQSSPGQTLHLQVQRADSVVSLSLTPGTKVLESGETVGYIGVAVKPIKWPENFVRTVRYGPLDSALQACQRTYSDIALTFSAVKKLIMGLISLKSLSGPITIARIAEESVSSGMESFLRFLAYLSVSLGVLNLLPVPVLDGGHLLYYGIELVTRRPLSERVQMIGLKIGVALILALMLIAFYNDLSRI